MVPLNFHHFNRKKIFLFSLFIIFSSGYPPLLSTGSFRQAQCGAGQVWLIGGRPSASARGCAAPLDYFGFAQHRFAQGRFGSLLRSFGALRSEKQGFFETVVFRESTKHVTKSKISMLRDC